MKAEENDCITKASKLSRCEFLEFDENLCQVLEVFRKTHSMTAKGQSMIFRAKKHSTPEFRESTFRLLLFTVSSNLAKCLSEQFLKINFELHQDRFEILIANRYHMALALLKSMPIELSLLEYVSYINVSKVTPGLSLRALETNLHNHGYS